MFLVDDIALRIAVKSVINTRFPLIQRFGPDKDDVTLFMVDTIARISRFAVKSKWKFIADADLYGGYWKDRKTGDIFYIDERGATKYLQGPVKSRLPDPKL